MVDYITTTGIDTKKGERFEAGATITSKDISTADVSWLLECGAIVRAADYEVVPEPEPEAEEEPEAEAEETTEEDEA